MYLRPRTMKKLMGQLQNYRERGYPSNGGFCFKSFDYILDLWVGTYTDLNGQSRLCVRNGQQDDALRYQDDNGSLMEKAVIDAGLKAGDRLAVFFTREGLELYGVPEKLTIIEPTGPYGPFIEAYLDYSGVEDPQCPDRVPVAKAVWAQAADWF